MNGSLLDGAKGSTAENCPVTLLYWRARRWYRPVSASRLSPHAGTFDALNGALLIRFRHEQSRALGFVKSSLTRIRLGPWRAFQSRRTQTTRALQLVHEATRLGGLNGHHNGWMKILIHSTKLEATTIPNRLEPSPSRRGRSARTSETLQWLSPIVRLCSRG
jgi:hypothetical protein